MQLTWLPDRRRYVGTQTEAKTLKADFEVRDVPTTKQELMDHLNAVEERHEREMAELRASLQPDAGDGDGGAATEEVAAAAESPIGIGEAVDPVDRPSLIDEDGYAKDLADQVGELGKDRLIPVLGAAIARLHEVAGFNGWAAFTKDVYSWTPAALAVERGMGMLMMAFFKNMDGVAPARAPMRAIVADPTIAGADS